MTDPFVGKLNLYEGILWYVNQAGSTFIILQPVKEKELVGFIDAFK